jgi:predicted 3-demethylubiquinone-9 3-methyltransferase (glyoxalase superfamily)
MAISAKKTRASKTGGGQGKNKGGKFATFLWFDKEAAEAAKFYASVFKGSKIKGTTILENTPSGTVELVTMELMGREFQLMSAGPAFKFNESISFVVYCDTQAEIDYYWAGLTADGGSEGNCGWLKDRFGVSWQVTPSIMGKIYKSKDKMKIARVLKAFLKMRKFDIAAIKRAAKGKI